MIGQIKRYNVRTYNLFNFIDVYVVNQGCTVVGYLLYVVNQGCTVVSISLISLLLSKIYRSDHRSYQSVEKAIGTSKKASKARPYQNKAFHKTTVFCNITIISLPPKWQPGANCCNNLSQWNYASLAVWQGA